MAEFEPEVREHPPLASSDTQGLCRAAPVADETQDVGGPAMGVSGRFNSGEFERKLKTAAAEAIKRRTAAVQRSLDDVYNLHEGPAGSGRPPVRSCCGSASGAPAQQTQPCETSLEPSPPAIGRS
jgi:hypothetical protein